MVSKSQIDRLGERLKAGAYRDEDLQELDAYRQTFVDAYTVVTNRIRAELGLEASGRASRIDGWRFRFGPAGNTCGQSYRSVCPIPSESN